MMTTAGVVTMGGVATTVAGDILAGVITMGGGILAGGTVGGTTNPRELTFARVCQRSDVSLVPYFLASCLGVARRPPQGAPPGPPPPSPWRRWKDDSKPYSLPRPLVRDKLCRLV